eukprot:54666-Eustigmatos_ZCMA.PRE.1
MAVMQPVAEGDTAVDEVCALRPRLLRLDGRSRPRSCVSNCPRSERVGWFSWSALALPGGYGMP